MATLFSPVTLSGAHPSSLETDWLVVPCAEGERLETLAEFNAASGGMLADALASGEFKGKACEVFATPVIDRVWRARRIAFVGLGEASGFDSVRLRRAATAAALAARDRGLTRVAFVCREPAGSPQGGGGVARLAQAVADGLVFALFDGAQYKTTDHDVWTPTELVISVDGEPGHDVVDAVTRGVILAECVNAARQLVNEPGNRLRPGDFAQRGAALATGAGLSAEILDVERVAALGMGLLLGVGRGSEDPPRLLVVRYQPQDAPPGPLLGLVGKGITFDTGGISIKPSQGMERMKDDMAGGAAVIAALCAMARLNARRPAIGVVPIAENMPGGRAIRPGDVVQSASGKTVEITDTDAEGRLILADALWYTRQLGATHLIDTATLTGACVVALGHTTSGLFGRPQPWVDTLRRVAEIEGDRVWPMPVFEDYREQLRSEIADLKNVGGRPAGAITAAVFLGEFAGDVPWAHLDVAGTAWNEDSKPYLPKGPTGVAVRTLAGMGFADW